MDKLRIAYENLLEDYCESQATLIWRHSTTIDRDIEKLRQECDELSRRWLDKPFSNE